MTIETPEDVLKADAFLRLNAALSTGTESVISFELGYALDLTNPGWRDREDFKARIEEIGPAKAAENLLARYQA